jgi:hypothetical protein
MYNRKVEPNAGPQPHLEATATQERRLEGVGCRLMLGARPAPALRCGLLPLGIAHLESPRHHYSVYDTTSLLWASR